MKVLAAACLAAVALIGCGGDDDPAPSEEARSETVTAERGRTTEEPSAEGAQAGRLRLVSLGRFASPLYVTAPPTDRRRVFVVEQGGRIRVIRGGQLVRRPFLDLSRLVLSGGEQGLLGLAFAPDYARSRRFYVHYTDRSGNTRVAEYRTRSGNPDLADPGSARIVLRAPGLEANHNGGQLAFGPDGLLYIGLGDGGGANDQHGRRGNGQSLGTVLGKILRIDPRPNGGRPYRVPTSNPFARRAGARGEIYSYGLRNPWRFSFDRETGDLAIGDVGQDGAEEIDFVERGRGSGANFGWRPYEGRSRIYDDEDAPGHIEPVLEKTHDGDGYCSITGGYVVRDPRLPSLEGRYVYSDFCTGRIRSVRLRSGGAEGDRAERLPRVGSVSSFGEDAAGRIYVTALDGPVYRLAE